MITTRNVFEAGKTLLLLVIAFSPSFACVLFAVDWAFVFAGASDVITLFKSLVIVVFFAVLAVVMIPLMIGFAVTIGDALDNIFYPLTPEPIFNLDQFTKSCKECDDDEL